MEKDELVLGGKVFTNRLFTGTGKFARNEDIAPMLEASGSQMVTVALRRIDFKFPQENILNFIPKNVISFATPKQFLSSWKIKKLTHLKKRSKPRWPISAATSLPPACG